MSVRRNALQLGGAPARGAQRQDRAPAVTGERMMIAHVYLQKGAIVPKHEHENEQLT